MTIIVAWKLWMTCGLLLLVAVLPVLAICGLSSAWPERVLGAGASMLVSGGVAAILLAMWGGL